LCAAGPPTPTCCGFLAPGPVFRRFRIPLAFRPFAARPGPLADGEKADEKVISAIAEIVHENRVQKLWRRSLKTGEIRVEGMCKTLWKSCREGVEFRWNDGGKDSLHGIVPIHANR
jgi:hypothetical protein